MKPTTEESIDTIETRDLLASILLEIKGLNQRLSGQGDRILQPRKNASFTQKRAPTNEWALPPFSAEARRGPLLEEAVQRYNANSLPRWNAHYGTHTSHRPTIQVPQQGSSTRFDWPSVVGDFWCIPNDNRVSLCFLAPPSDITTALRVRNFVTHFHNTQARGAPNGDCLNVWDWFDSGTSRYWHPDKMSPMPALDHAPEAAIRGEEDKTESAPRISPLIAPWRRVIHMQGLTTLDIGSSSDVDADKLGDDDLCPVLLAEAEEDPFQRPLNRMIWGAVRCHLRCRRATAAHHAELLTKGGLLFHVTFYEMLGAHSSENMVELWPHGELHSDGHHTYSGGSGGGKRPRVRESALTIIAVPSADLPGPKTRAIFWTMIILRPHGFPYPHYYETGGDLAQGGRTRAMADEVADTVHECVGAVVGRWDELAAYFDGLLGEKKALLDPDRHDTLLTDDWTLSRSRRYFWAIEFLKEVEASVADNIRQAERFLALFRDSLQGGDGAEGGDDARRRLARHEAMLARLEALRARFVQRREEAVALRDGLFNASAVMESRTSTKLGENIKLLTLISIFFLPLSFCTSLWSISDQTFSIAAFAATMPVLALATYAATWNLDRIAALLDGLQQKAFSGSSGGGSTATAAHVRLADRPQKRSDSREKDGGAGIWARIQLFGRYTSRGRDKAADVAHLEEVNVPV